MTEQVNVQKLESSLIEQKAVLIKHRIALYRALGGDWDPTDGNAMTSTTHKRHPLIRLVRLFLPILFIAASIAAANYLYATRPLADRGRPLVPPPLVETMTVSAADHVVTLSAMGTVIPSRSMTLKSRVGGFVQEKSEKMIPGGLFKKGEVMIELEQADFMLDLEQQEAVLARLNAELRLEMGKQEVAREEVRILQKNLRRSLSNSELAPAGTPAGPDQGGHCRGREPAWPGRVWHWNVPLSRPLLTAWS